MLDCVPAPQVTEQADHADQSDQAPFALSQSTKQPTLLGEVQARSTGAPLV